MYLNTIFAVLFCYW